MIRLRGNDFGLSRIYTSCERAAPDAPETIDDQRRSTGCRYGTIYGGSRGSASLPAPAKWLGPSTPTVYTNDSILTETKAFVYILAGSGNGSIGGKGLGPGDGGVGKGGSGRGSTGGGTGPGGVG